MQKAEVKAPLHTTNENFHCSGFEIRFVRFNAHSATEVKYEMQNQSDEKNSWQTEVVQFKTWDVMKHEAVKIIGKGGENEIRVENSKHPAFFLLRRLVIPILC